MAGASYDTGRRRWRRWALGGAAAAVSLAVLLGALLSGGSSPAARPPATAVAERLFDCPTEGRFVGPAPAIPDLRQQQRLVRALTGRRWAAFRVTRLQASRLGVVALVTGDVHRARRTLARLGVRHVARRRPAAAADGRGQIARLLASVYARTFRQVGRARRGIPGYQEIARWSEAGTVLLQYKAPVPAAITRLAGTRRNGVRVVVVPTRFSARDLRAATDKAIRALNTGEVDGTFELSEPCADGSGIVVGILPASLGDRRAAVQRQLTAVAGVPVRVMPGEVTPASRRVPRAIACHRRTPPMQRVVPASSTVAYVVSGTTATTTAGRELFRTADRGRTFVHVAAPRAVGHRGHQLPLADLVFVNARDGYALLGDGDYGVGTTTVMSTSDGGRTWRRDRVGGHVVAVAGHGDEVFAVTVACTGVEHCRRLALYRAEAGSWSWRRLRPVLPSRDESNGVGLAAWDSSVWLMLGMGSSPRPATVRSVDSGATFTTIPSVNGNACSPAATSGRVIWTTCSSGMMLEFDRQVGAAPPRSLPVTGSGTGNTFLDPVSDTSASFATALGDRAGISLTRDGGRTFHRTGPVPARMADAVYPDSTVFFDARTGLGVAPGEGLYRTGDTGRSWHRLRLGITG